MDYKILSILKSVYNETNRGVSYAETKNAVLIGFNIALLGVAASLGNGLQGCALAGLILLIILLTVAASFSLAVSGSLNSVILYLLQSGKIFYLICRQTFTACQYEVHSSAL